jgi:hypothetical protein
LFKQAFPVKSLPSIVKGFVISNKVDRRGEQDYQFSYIQSFLARREAATR